MGDSIYIYGLSGTLVGKEIPIPPKKETTLGRSLKTDVHLLDLSLSRKHCRIRYFDKELTLSDLGSTNGTYLNGKHMRPGKEYPIDDGDIFHLGDNEFEVRVYDEDEDTSDGDELIIEDKTYHPSEDSDGPSDGEELIPRTQREPRRKIQPGAGKSPVGPPRIGALFDKYKIIEKIGEGNMGQVFIAEHYPLNRMVALKVINVDPNTSSTQMERFLRGARINSKLHHPNIVTLFDAGKQGCYYYLAMELVPGHNIAELLEEQGKFTVPEAVDIVSQTLAGLEYCHEQNVIHRDIKPANLLRNARGRVKISDLGIARAIQESGTELSNVTIAGSVVGTPKYMPPEQYNDSAGVDHRCDIYSAGVTLYELLTGQIPFDADNLISLARKITFEKPPLVSSIEPDVPAELSRVIIKAMAKSADERFPTAGKFRKALEPFLGD